MTQGRTKLWYLKNLDIFSHLTDEQYGLIDQIAAMRPVKKGEVLYFQGATDNKFYMLKKGVVKITKLTPHGNEIILDIVSGVSLFGEIGVLNPQERDESAVVVEDGLICAMTREDFERLVQVIPGLVIKMTKMIGLRRWKIESKLLDLLYRTVEQRLAKTFLSLLDDFSIPHGDGYLLKIKLTHKDFADLIASTRETVTTTLNKLKSEGLIDFEGKYLVIKQLEEVRSLA